VTNADGTVNVVPAGAAIAKDKATSGGTAGSGAPGSSTKADTTPDKTAELAELVKKQSQVIEKLEKQDRSNQEQIGRLGDELGQLRQQSTQSVDSSKIAENFQSMLLNRDDPMNALAAINYAIEAKMGVQDNEEAKRAKAFIDVTARRPEFKDISYNDVMLTIRANGGSLDGLSSNRGMEKALESIRSQMYGSQDWGAKEATIRKEEREKYQAELQAAGGVPGGTGTSAPQPPKQLTEEEVFLRKWAESMGIIPPQ